MVESLKVGVVNASTPGADSNTYIIVDSTVSFGVNIAGDPRNATLKAHGISRILVGIKNSHLGTLKAYRSVDKGTNWDQVGGDIAVPASAAIILDVTLGATGTGLTLRGRFITFGYLCPQ